MHMPVSLNTWWIRSLITWLTYTVAGVMAVALAAPTDFVSPLFLPAGLALAFVLCWGTGMVAPVGLGSVCVALFFLVMSRGDMPPADLMLRAVFTGLGAALQAWVGYRLVRTRTPPELTLERPTQIARFLMLAGPLACTISAAVSMLAMVALGELPLTKVPSAFLGWWAGDTLGVLIGAPMLLPLIGQPADSWRPRRLLVSVPMLVTTVVLSLALRQVQAWDAERQEAVFTQAQEAATNAVKLRLNAYLHALEALNSLYVGSATVERDGFASASRYWLSTLPGIQALGWEEHVLTADLHRFEAQQQAEGLTQYKVFDGLERKPPTGPEVLALRFIEPIAGNETALGLNVLSRPSSRQALDEARRTDRAIATRGFHLTQESAKQQGVVVYHPVYKGKPYTPQARIQATRGAVFMALRMDDATAAMLQGMPDYIQACLYETSEGQRQLLGGAPICHRGEQGVRSHHRKLVPIDFAGQTWELVIWADKPVPVIGSGATYWLLAFSGVLLSAALGTLLLVMTGHNRRMEAAMREARRLHTQAEAANQAKSEFLSRMSHELRTPLNAVLGFAQVMELDQQAALSPNQRQRVQQIQQAGWHLLDMIDDVLDISRMDTGTLRLQTEPMSVQSALQGVTQATSELARKQGIALNWPAPVSPQWGVTADPARLRQILSNLLSNAIEYNRPGGSVSVEVQQLAGATSTDAPRVAIRVSDTGMGMSAEQVSQLFEPFNRLGRERSQPDGTGIGLVISRHLALLMGGSIEVSSVPDQGSTFTLLLPGTTLAAPAQVTPPAPVSPPAAPRPSEAPHRTPGMPHEQHVLYVEDNLANGELVRAALTARPWITVNVSPTIEEGLSVLHNRMRGPQPDLILLDVHLPDASGLDFLKLLKANPDTIKIPVIMISADAMPEQIDAALAAGACCYLTKPVQLPELLRQVDELLGN
jgi:signal transduction histidine kinase/integral membrane sensor domain MASE1/ActR/RegA family two-component response regulator